MAAVLQKITVAYALSRKEIDKYVTRKSAGNYMLGNVIEDTFCPRYVGWADYDVAERLKDHADAENEDCGYFIFFYAASKKAAFERKCKDYYHFGGNKKLDSEIHREDQTKHIGNARFVMCLIEF